MIGRSEECEIHLPDASISRRHARLVAPRGAWLVTDLGSRHGTYLNTIRLDPDEEVTLRDGDLLQVGPWTMSVRLQNASPADERPEPPLHAPPNAPPDAPLHAPPDAPLHAPAHAPPHAPPNAPPDALPDAPPDAPPALDPRHLDPTSTRATMFIRLRDDRTAVRELSWQEFSDRYGSIIVGCALNAGLSRHDADDVLQNVLLAFFRVAADFEYDRSKGRFRGYLKRMTLNAVRERWRRERVVPRVGLDDEVPDPDRLDALWERQWTRHVLQRALERVRTHFEPQTMEAFELFGRRGMKSTEVALQLGMSEESVRHAKSRVTRALREVVERVREEEEGTKGQRD